MLALRGIDQPVLHGYAKVHSSRHLWRQVAALAYLSLTTLFRHQIWLEKKSSQIESYCQLGEQGNKETSRLA